MASNCGLVISNHIECILKTQSPASAMNKNQILTKAIPTKKHLIVIFSIVSIIVRRISYPDRKHRDRCRISSRPSPSFG